MQLIHFYGYQSQDFELKKTMKYEQADIGVGYDQSLVVPSTEQVASMVLRWNKTIEQMNEVVMIRKSFKRLIWAAKPNSEELKIRWYDVLFAKNLFGSNINQFDTG